MGVRHCFTRLYGPDLVNALKTGPEFYERIFADAGVEPEKAVVVDDSPQALAWAVQVGAKTVLIHTKAAESYPADRVIDRLARLPEVILFTMIPLESL